jgi:hypothetical protein
MVCAAKTGCVEFVAKATDGQAPRDELFPLSFVSCVKHSGNTIVVFCIERTG